MKLISCYLENFGCFNKKEFVFNENLTVINEDNGYGKSTLVAFIKAMFYGLDSYRDNYNRDGALPERLHYYPFSGGEFGGNLTFIFNDKEYKIERFFAQKSETGDSLKVYVGGVETFELGENIGKTVFGVDKQSFERLAFISSEEIEIKSTSSINLKLNEFLNGNVLDVSLDEAVSKLDNKAKEYKKSRQSRDKITITQERVAELSSKIINAKLIENSLSAKEEKLKSISDEIKSLSVAITETQKQVKVLKDFERYEELLSLAKSSEQKASEIALKYGGKIPTEEEVKTLSESIAIKREYEALSKVEFSETEREKYQALSKVFVNGVPSSEQIESAESCVQKLSELSATESVLKTEMPAGRAEELDNKFSNNFPSKETLGELEKDVLEYRDLNQRVETAKRFNLQEEQRKAYRPSKAFPITAIIAGFVLALGIGLIFINLILGVVFAILGALSLMVAGFMYINSKTNAYQMVIPPDYSAELTLLSTLQMRIGLVLSRYGYDVQDGVIVAYNAFVKDLNDYHVYMEFNDKNKEKLLAVQSEIALLRGKLKAFFEKYSVLSFDNLTALSNLKNSVTTYNLLKERVKSIEDKKSEASSQLLKTEEFINAFSAKYRLDNIDLANIHSDVTSYLSERSNALSIEERAETFKAENNLSEKPSEALYDLAELNDKITALQEEYAILNSEIEGDEYAVEKLDGYLSEKLSLEETLNSYKKNYELLTATKDLLLKAEQNLKDKYVKPVKDEFVRYAYLLEQTLGEKVTMTKNFEVTFERGGKERSDKHLSQGVKSICALCFRLALIKNMYVDKAPFLILDDPFVYLDGEHIEKVKSIIKDLSNDMQIVYFTCHDSRVIK